MKKSHKGTYGSHIDWVFKDPEFGQDLLDDVFGGAKRPKDYYLNKYFVPHSAIAELAVVDEGAPSHTAFGIKHNRIAKTITLSLSDGVTKKEFDDIWKFLQWYREKRLFISRTTKRKPPENGQLIYAVFKARQKSPPTTFREIFRQYQNKELPLYNGSRSLKSEDSLERYYNKYKPKRPDS